MKQEGREEKNVTGRTERKIEKKGRKKKGRELNMKESRYRVTVRFFGSEIRKLEEGGMTPFTFVHVL